MCWFSRVTSWCFKKIIVVDVSKYKKVVKNHGLLIMINPEIIEAEGFVINRKRCLSITNFIGNGNQSENRKYKSKVYLHRKE